MSLAGFASGGPDIIMTGSLAVDLGSGKRNNVSGVAGIINGFGLLGAVLQGGQYLKTQCGVNFFILDSRRVLAPAPKVLGSDIKTHLESRFCAIPKKRGAI